MRLEQRGQPGYVGDEGVVCIATISQRSCLASGCLKLMNVAPSRLATGDCQE